MALKLSTIKQVALIQGGLGAERKISLLSGKAIACALSELNIPYYVIDADQYLPKKLSELKPDVAFLAVHGKYAEDGILQSLCEYLKIPYTGSGVLASCVCMDKCFFKDVMKHYHIPTPEYQRWNLKGRSLNHITPPPESHFPLVVKPSREGSSLGISICHTAKDFLPAIEVALVYDTQILLESYIKGPELAVSFLGGQVLTPIEIVPKSGFYDYTHKYTPGHTKYILPPRVSDNVISQCKAHILFMINVLKIRGICRADFIVKNNIPLMTEINTLPGLTATSLLPQSAEYEGISFNQVVQILLKNATLDYV